MTDLPPSPLDRYSRQVLFEGIGREGQERLLESRVTLVGCGALGTVLANTLVRAGVGFLRICDRDYIEPNNLQRQVLFDESDVLAGLPKAEAAARKLRAINSEVQIEGLITDVDPSNIERIIDGAHLLLDGTDNFETRYLINDASVRFDLPWVYGAVIGATGLMMPILPGETPCLRCVFESAPPPEMSPTCDTAGVIGPAVNVVASLQAVEAMKILMGHLDEVNRSLVSIDVWSGRIVPMNMDAASRQVDCPCCGQMRFEYLDRKATSSSTTLCGRDAVQISPAGRANDSVDLAALAGRLTSASPGSVTHNRFMLKAELGKYTLTVFPDGRAIIKGTKLPEEARTVYAKYVGA